MTRQERNEVLFGFYKSALGLLCLLAAALMVFFRFSLNHLKTGMICFSVYCICVCIALAYGLHLKKSTLACCKHKSIYNEAIELRTIGGRKHLIYSFSFDPAQPWEKPQCVFDCLISSISNLSLDPEKMQLGIFGDLRVVRTYKGMSYVDEVSSTLIPLCFDENMEILDRLLRATGLTFTTLAHLQKQSAACFVL